VTCPGVCVCVSVMKRFLFALRRILTGAAALCCCGGSEGEDGG
jgi:hypothetical protein